MNFLVSSISGWFAALLVLATLTLPYTIRRRVTGPRPPLAGRYRARMQAHYWIGFTILAIVLFHTIFTAAAGMAFRARTMGIVLAIAALAVVVTQVMFGLKLRRPEIVGRIGLRRLHLGAMVAIVVLTGAHVLLNSPLASGLRAD